MSVRQQAAVRAGFSAFSGCGQDFSQTSGGLTLSFGLNACFFPVHAGLSSSAASCPLRKLTLSSLVDVPPSAFGINVPLTCRSRQGFKPALCPTPPGSCFTPRHPNILECSAPAFRSGLMSFSLWELVSVHLAAAAPRLPAGAPLPITESVVIAQEAVGPSRCALCGARGACCSLTGLFNPQLENAAKKRERTTSDPGTTEQKQDKKRLKISKKLKDPDPPEKDFTPYDYSKSDFKAFAGEARTGALQGLPAMSHGVKKQRAFGGA